MTRKKPRSIIAAALAIWAFTAAIPLLAILGIESIISGYYRGEPNMVTRIFKPAPPMAKLYRQTDSVTRRANAALVNDPSRLFSQDFLDSLILPGISVHILVADGSSYHAGKFRDIQPYMLPPFGAVINPDSPPPNPERTPFFVLDQMDFYTADRIPASFYVLRDGPPKDKPRKDMGFTAGIALYSVLLLVALNGIAGIFFMLRLTKPLSSLEEAAHALGKGDFTITIKKPGIRELDPVFHAFDAMKQKLSALMRREREDERTRRELIANLSHDIRTPLTAMRGYLDGLADGVADTPEKQARYMKTIREQATRMSGMIDDIFLMATLQDASAKSEKRVFDIVAFLRSGAEDLSEIHSLQRLTVSLLPRVGTGIQCLVQGDPLQLRRVMENLASNTVRHCGRTDPAIQLGINIAKDSVTITACDNGKGFPPDSLSKVFDRTWKADGSRHALGNGLGLAIAKEIITSHGGTISASNDEAAGTIQGACIEFTLPLADAQATESEP